MEAQMTSPLAGLGRLHSPDPRDRAYKMVKPRAAAEVEQRYWITRGQLDQLSTPHCVAFSGVRYLTTSPCVNKPVDTTVLYNECQKVDEWEGESYDGTSVRALFKILQQRGYISEYRWAFDAETVIAHVLAVGPVVMGTTWTIDMFMPDRRGFITFTGEPVGGHAWTIIGASRKKQAVRMINSWGPNWGASGRAWVSFADLDALIKDYGEACTAKELRVIS
jgi:hypothetical protein